MKCVVITVLFSLICFSAAAKLQPLKDYGIVHGRPTNNSEVPYIVYLMRSKKFFCGGSMVSQTHVVTAAHCVDGVERTRLTVVGGATYLTDKGFRSQVEQVFVHEEWDSETFSSDIAVLKLRTKMPNSVKPLPLCRKPIKEGSSMQISGWGHLKQHGSKSNQLQTFKSVVADWDLCEEAYYHYWESVDETMFCVSTKEGKDSCQGDSGGPAVFNGQLCGVVSWGIGCAYKGLPGIYTNVYNFKDFVQRSMAL